MKFIKTSEGSRVKGSVTKEYAGEYSGYKVVDGITYHFEITDTGKSGENKWNLKAVERQCGGCDTLIYCYFTLKEAKEAAAEASLRWWTEL